jgi:hypothetical protein
MNELIIEKIDELRKQKNQINFVQIGAYDGKSIDDVANKILITDDVGLFIEPNPHILDVLKKEKEKFVNSKILPFAIIPDNNFYHEHFHVHKFGGGSSFIRGLHDGPLSIHEHYEVLKVETITVEELFKSYIDFEIDVLFTDCEGYDYDINKKILEICLPKIIYMEAWDTKNLDLPQKITTRDEMFDFLKTKNYDCFFNSYGENLTCLLNEKRN